MDSKAGITDIRVQPFVHNPASPFWLPLSWEVRLLADPVFGPGSADVVTDLADGLPMVECCGGEIGQVLVNLFRNAVESGCGVAQSATPVAAGVDRTLVLPSAPAGASR